jgi:2',3'-cyclic-nucleotide 2'-phosphodiesterase (5'-nucleotidase family)
MGIMVKVNFVGDVSIFKEYQQLSIDPFKEIYLPESDYNIGNFEFVIPDNRDKYFFDVSEQYAVDFDYFRSLKLNRFNAFGIANNHCMDYGKEGVKDVINVLKENNIFCFGMGIEDFNILKFELKSISFAIIGVAKTGRWSRNSERLFGPDSYNIDKIIDKIKSLKEEVDHVIVFPHFGTELVDIPDPADVKNSRLMIDNGASAVIGHHPHIIQGIENYKDGIIAYSLGSFIYIPENEEGYKTSQNRNRDFSICLNLTFDRKRIIGTNPVYYKYDEKLKIPVPLKEREPYFDLVNSNIDNKKEYYTKIRRELLKREINSFYQRFRKSPLSTIKHYLSYIKLKHIKKIIS